MAVTDTVEIKTYYPSIAQNYVGRGTNQELLLWRMQSSLVGDSSGDPIVVYFNLDSSERGLFYVVTDLRIFMGAKTAETAGVDAMKDDWVRYSLMSGTDVCVAQAAKLENLASGSSVFPFSGDQLPINLGQSKRDGTFSVSIDTNTATKKYFVQAVGVESTQPITLPSSLELRSLI